MDWASTKPLVNICWQNYVYLCTRILIVADFRGRGGGDSFSKRVMSWFLSCTMKDQRWISELSPEPRTMYSLHQSLHPGRHPDSDPNPWRRNRLERARDFHEAGTIPQLVYKSKFPRIMGSTAQFFCPGKYHGTMLIQRQPCTHIKKEKHRLQNDLCQTLKSLYSFL